MRILFVVDARSPIARNWIGYFLSRNVEVHVISTVPTDPFDSRIRSFHVVPIALGRTVAKVRSASSSGTTGSLQRTKRNLATHLSRFRSVASAYDVYGHVSEVTRLIDGIAPDIVHAMRVPYEGIAAAAAVEGRSVPLLISVWGNDFTLHAMKSRRLERMTKRALGRADALHPDCSRDLVLARQFNWDESKLSRVLPGAGGVQRDVFRPGPREAHLGRELHIPADAIVVINPRRMAPYVAQENFFAAVAEVTVRHPNVVFLAVAMEGHQLAEKWIRRYAVQHAVRLLPAVDRSMMARLFRLSDIVVSLGNHDGTPNTLLEGMACGCLPVVGAIESVLEWVEDGVNGLTCNQQDPHSIAIALERAIEDSSLRQRAGLHNQRLIDERADHSLVMRNAMELYEQLAQAGRVDLDKTATGAPLASGFALRRTA